MKDYDSLRREVKFLYLPIAALLGFTLFFGGATVFALVKGTSGVHFSLAGLIILTCISGVWTYYLFEHGRELLRGISKLAKTDDEQADYHIIRKGVAESGFTPFEAFDANGIPVREIQAAEGVRWKLIGLSRGAGDIFGYLLRNVTTPEAATRLYELVKGKPQGEVDTIFKQAIAAESDPQDAWRRPE